MISNFNGEFEGWFSLEIFPCLFEYAYHSMDMFIRRSCLVWRRLPPPCRKANITELLFHICTVGIWGHIFFCWMKSSINIFPFFLNFSSAILRQELNQVFTDVCFFMFKKKNMFIDNLIQKKKLCPQIEVINKLSLFTQIE